jgi:hypothetical protein
MKRAALLLGLVVGLPLAGAAEKPVGPPVTPEAMELFEKHIRPILAEHCIRCHGPKKQKSELRLDSRAAMLKGNDSGPAIVPGNPDRSMLIQAIRYNTTVKMPPPGKLPHRAITALTAWVKMGAPWPDDRQIAGKETGKADPHGDAKKHWAFQPVRKPALPAVPKKGWAVSPIDAFVLARLETNRMTPARPADRRTLIRRATYDLIGLPPTAEETAAFEADRAPDAFAKVVDRLLRSPRYGERWGRYWLDVARYADTKGYVFTEERVFPYSYTYRDYVIRAFNEDLPYDRFIVEQLAADLLPLGKDNRALAAMGFLTVGRRFLNNTHDIIDDRIDVVARGLLGLTVSCARCHDHKFDPIPTKDYYSLYGVFASSAEPPELPLIGTPEQTPAYLAFAKELKIREGKLDAFARKAQAELVAKARARIADYLLAANDLALSSRRGRRDRFVGDLSFPMVRRWQGYLRGRDKKDPIFGPWQAFAVLDKKEFPARAPALAAQIAAGSSPGGPINPVVSRAFAGKGPKTLKDVAGYYGVVFAETEKLWQRALDRVAVQQGVPAPEGLSDPSQEALRQALYGPNSPFTIPVGEVGRYVDRAARNKITELRKQVEQWKVTSPGAPPRAMILRDLPTPVAPHVLLRGNPGNPGPLVPRQFLEVLAGPSRHPFPHGSGRLDLARAIADKNNPLTARVMVNRIWLHHFGAGLVRTPSDFGLRSEPPTQPELLDYLAWRFTEDGWSIKKMHRLIMLSSVYQQDSENSGPFAAVDPDNRWLWKMNRRRLDFEAMRDSLLAVSGKLDLTMGGRSVNLTSAPFTGRRTVYGFIDRQNLPGLFRTFDFASPDTSSSRRFATTVPQQALFLMNSPFVVEQVRSLAGQKDFVALKKAGDRIAHLYRRVYGRQAEEEEVKLGLRFVQAAEQDLKNPIKPDRVGSPSLTPWEKYAQVLVLANEFMFVD